MKNGVVRTLAVVASVAVALACGSAQASVWYELQLLPAPDGLSRVAAWGINNGGTIAGSGSLQGRGIGIVWTHDGAVQTIPVPLAAINDVGQVVGAFQIWNPDGSMTELELLWPQLVSSPDINDSGQVVATHVVDMDKPWLDAYTWDAEGRAVRLPKDPYSVWPYNSSIARGGINNDGRIGGDTSELGGVIWEPDGSVTVVEEMIYVYSINNVNQIVGRGRGDAPYYTKLLIKDPDGTITVIEDAIGEPTALNNLGQVVATKGVASWFWSAADGAIALPGLPGGTETHVYDLNDSGIAVGYVRDADGRSHAAMWVPVPEPAGLIALSLGVGLAVIKRRR